MTTRIICLGNSTLDKIWPINELPKSSGKYGASDYLESGGGMAANAAVAAARLGGSVAYWGRAGEDTTGEIMKNEMRSYGVDVTHFRLFQGARSSTSAILVTADGERVIINYRGTNIPNDPAWLPLDLVKEMKAVLADIRWVDGACALFSAARAAGIPTVLDGETASREAFATILKLVDHAVFSESGLDAFAGYALDDDAGRIAILKEVRAMGCRVAALTRGSAGIIWMDETGVHFQPAFAVHVVDTTGAGDVFHGAYTLALGERSEVSSAMRFASAVAGLKCTRHGGRAGIPTRAEVMAFLTKHTSAPPFVGNACSGM